MKPVTIIVLAILISTISCKKEKQEIPLKKTAGEYHVSTIKEVWDDGTMTIKSFKYNEDYYVIQYTGSVQYSQDTLLTKVSNITFQRDKKNKIVSDSVSDPGFYRNNKGTYEYDTHAQLTKVTYKAIGATSYIDNIIYYEWEKELPVKKTMQRANIQYDVQYSPNENITSAYHKSYDQEEYTTDTKYDDKKNYYTTFKDKSTVILLFGLNVSTMSANNVLSYSYTGESINKEYKYNSVGLPVEIKTNKGTVTTIEYIVH